jgi:predicted RNA-binding Zn-ribbon protein involved in translation (DUF1610 family)
MGQAKKRGTQQERIAESQAKVKTPVHIFINENRLESLLLSTFPCAECGKHIAPDPEMDKLLLIPVKHAFQVGGCPDCGAQHVILSAATKADCILLEPVSKAFRENMPNVFRK